MALLTKEQILASKDRRFEIVTVEEWGGDVRLQSLLENEYHDFRDAATKRMGKNREVNLRTVRACLLAACIVDEAGKPMFIIEELKEKSAHAIALLFKVAGRMNGFDDDDLEDLAKNSATGLRAGSPSS